MDIELGDIKPQAAEIFVGGEAYTLRKFNLEDEVWLRDTFKGEPIFTEQMTTDHLCRIAFHQLTMHDKEKFQPIDVTIINEDTGEKSTVKMGGWKLFRAKISGQGEKLIIFKGLLHTVGISRPMLNKILSEEEKKQLMIEEEKTQPKVKKKRAGQR